MTQGSIEMKFGYILFAATVLLQSISQILEKKGISQLGQINGVSDYLSISFLTKAITNPCLLSGVIISAIGLICWLGALSQFKVSYLYSFGAISYMLVAVLAWGLLGESLSLTRWVGIIVIVAGCALINF